MRVLALETSSRRGSAALWDSGRLVCNALHEEPNAHGERMLPLVQALVAEAQWPASSIDRLGVGVGPGSFTGLRVGIALGQGLALGLDRPLVGVVSLEAMAAAAPASQLGLRWALLDARRGEVFAAVYDEQCRQQLAPTALPAGSAFELLLQRFPGPRLLLGEVDVGCPDASCVFHSPTTDLPHADQVAQLAAAKELDSAPAVPLYVRDADAIRPHLPPSPLAE